MTTSFIVHLSQDSDTAVIINATVDFMVMAAIFFSLAAMLYQDRKVKKKEELTGATIPGDIAPWRPLLAGFGCGIVIGATGVDGGVLLLPILTVLLQVNIKQAIGSSIVIALLLSGLSAMTYSGGGQTDMTTAIILIMGSLVGVPLAGYLMKLMSDVLLHRITLGLITISALLMLSNSLA